MGDPVYNGPSSHLVARLVLMLGMICAVIAQMIGLRTQMEMESSDVGNMKALQTKLYKETVVALNTGSTDQLDEPSERWSPANSTLSENAETVAVATSHSKRERETTGKLSLEDHREIQIQEVINKQSHVPLNEAGQIDWNQIDHVYYYHTRKAGGTTLVQWVRAVAWKHNKTFSKDEGPVFDHKEWENDKRRVLFVTSLRPPVDRVISSYTFDQNQNGVNSTLSEFVDSCEHYNTKKKRLYFDKKKEKNRGWIWICASECYGKWFGSWPTPSLQANTIKAAETLNEYEIIWMKNLRNEEYMSWLLHRFNATDTPIKRKRTTHLPKPKLTREELSYLDDINQWDNLMYESLRRKWEVIVNLNETLV